MKKLFLLFVLISLIPISSSASSLADTLKGKILLQVEQNGEAWYIMPSSGKRIYIKNGDTAYYLMRSFGVGISNKDLAKIPIGVEDRFECLDTDSDGLCNKLEEVLKTDSNKSDTDGDSHSDAEELKNGYDPIGPDKLKYDYGLINRAKGQIFLQVESRGEAWYINPADGRRYYMADGQAAYQIMRYLSLGITNSNLAKIANYYNGYVDGNGSWGLNFGKTISLTDIKDNLPKDITYEAQDISAYDKEYFMTEQEYQAAYHNNHQAGDCVGEKSAYYCSQLVEGQWVKQAGSNISFLLENDKVYRRLDSLVNSLVLVKKISDKLTIFLRLHNERMDNGQEVTAYSIYTIGGNDELSGFVSRSQLVMYYEEMFQELDLDTSTLKNIIWGV